MKVDDGLYGEIARIRRVSDMLCTAHAGLRDYYGRLALALDLSILILSAWLSALAFISPTLNISVTPFGLDPQLWAGVLSVTTLVLAIVQLRTDLKAQSDAHRRAMSNYSNLKREASYLLANDSAAIESVQRIISNYDMASAVSVEIPERYFLSQKRKHKMKVAISRHLDDHPGASITLTRIKIWIRDNFQREAPRV